VHGQPKYRIVGHIIGAVGIVNFDQSVTVAKFIGIHAIHSSDPRLIAGSDSSVKNGRKDSTAYSKTAPRRQSLHGFSRLPHFRTFALDIPEIPQILTRPRFFQDFTVFALKKGLPDSSRQARIFRVILPWAADSIMGDFVCRGVRDEDDSRLVVEPGGHRGPDTRRPGRGLALRCVRLSGGVLL
jgi:hypothetical protein